MRLRLLLVLPLLLALGLPVPGARAESYSYVDEEGRLHFTDSLHAVPPAQREAAQAQAQENAADDASLESYLKKERTTATRVLTAEIDAIRRGQGLHTLSHAEKRELSAMIRRWMPLLIAADVILALVLLVLTVHSLATRKPRWALINLLLLGLPAPLYASRHFAQRQRRLKLTVTVVSVSPTLILTAFCLDFVPALLRLLGSP
ncbi:MAG: DUF4124 domain-containing protein [Myxococcota bacterium]